MSLAAPSVVPGRSCDGCAMCCKIPRIDVPELQKPGNTWCQFCSTRQKCDNYENRPQPCRDFICDYLTNQSIGEEWKPSKSKMLIMTDSRNKRLAVHVDPQRPDAWKQEPYYSTLKKWSKQILAQDGHLAVTIDGYVYVIFPDHDADLGKVSDDGAILICEAEDKHMTAICVKKSMLSSA